MSLWLLMLTVGLQADGSEQLLTEAKVATESAHNGLRSARGVGLYEETVSRGATRADLKTTDHIRATFHMAFDGPKNFVQLQYQVADGYEPDYKSRVVIYDGQNVYLSRFSPTIEPFGAEGEVWAPSQDFGAEGGFPALVFPVTFSQLAKAWVKVEPDRIRKFMGDDAQFTVRDEAGIKVVRAEASEIRNGETRKHAAEFWIDPARANHLVRFRLLRNDAVLNDVEKHWAKQGDVWFVKRYETRRNRDREDECSTEYSRFEFEAFEPNVPIPDALFTIDGLGLPVGSRIMEQREGFDPYKEIIVGTPSTDVQKLETVVGKLPRSQIVDPPKSTQSPTFVDGENPRWPFVTAAIGIVMLGLGVAVWLRTSRAGKAS